MAESGLRHTTRNRATPKGSVGSNPTPSAIFIDLLIVLAAAMTLQNKEALLVERLLILPDGQERLASLVKKKPTLPAHDCVDEWLVVGCSSRVWIKADLADSLYYFRYAADSPLVGGLVAVSCELASGFTAREIGNHSFGWARSSRISEFLSVTRRSGLEAIHARIKQLVVYDSVN